MQLVTTWLSLTSWSIVACIYTLYLSSRWLRNFIWSGYESRKWKVRDSESWWKFLAWLMCIHDISPETVALRSGNFENKINTKWSKFSMHAFERNAWLTRNQGGDMCHDSLTYIILPRNTCVGLYVYLVYFYRIEKEHAWQLSLLYW